MQADRWKMVEELFEAARHLPADRRTGFLREASPNDPELHAEVESLLRAAESGDPLLDGSPLSSVLERPPVLKGGDKLGSFEIVGMIGRGGMGEVYRARDPRLKRDVAIKTLPRPFAADRNRVARFEREARAASALNHPNIVSIHDIGVEGGVWFIVSELVEGETLAQMLKRGPLAPRKLIEVGTQITQGLAAAHAAGVVHRDLKPGNLMLTRDGRLKILDFGLARLDQPPAADQATIDVSLPGLILGTPSYMSPEQVRGEPADARSDLFSLGVILHEMASGEMPFRGTSEIEVMNSVLKDDAPELPPTSPPGLDRVVRRCLEKQPAMRFQSAADLGFTLGSLLAQQPAIAPLRSRRYWLIWVAVAAVCLATAGIGYWLRGRATMPSALPDAFLHRLTNDAGLAMSAAISSDGKLVAYASDRSDSSNLDIWVQQLNSGGAARGAIRITDDPTDDYDPSFTSDGTQIAFRSERDGGGIYLVSALGGDARLLISKGRLPRFSPQGEMLLYSADAGSTPTGLFVQRAPGEPPVQIGAGCDVDPASAAWSPDGRRVMFSAACDAQAGGLWVSTLDGKRTAGPGGMPAIRRIDQWLPGPSRLLCDATALDGASIVTVPVSEDGTKVTGQWKKVTFSTQHEGHASTAADGSVVFSTQDSETHIWGVPIDENGRSNGAAMRLTSRPARQEEDYPVLSRDGRNLTILSPWSGLLNLFYKNLSTGKEREVSSGIPTEIGEAFSPDASRIIFQGANYHPGDDRVYYSVYEVPVAGGAPKRLWGPEPVTQVVWDWAPDGATVLFLPDNQGKMFEMDLHSHTKVAFLDEPEFSVYQGHFSHDGRWVTFNGIKNGRSRIYVAPFRKARVPSSEWIPVTDGQADDKPRFSHDGRLIFFTSDRDGFRCIWAQRVGPEMRPAGPPFASYHSHQRRRSLANVPVEWFQTDVGPNMIVFNQSDLTGEIWLFEPAKAVAP